MRPLCILWLCACATWANAQSRVQPLLKQFCFDCHGAQKQEASLRIDSLNHDLVKGDDAETWHDILNRLNLGEMPPEDSPQPTAQQRETLTKWLTAELKRAAEVQRSTGGRVVLRRLNRDEYANTMRDLLGIDLDYAKNLPPEPTSPDGFKNNGAALGMSPLQMEYYLKTAREAFSKVIVTGDAPEVYRHQVEKSEKARRKNEQFDGNRIPRGGRFLARMQKYPTEGEFLVRVRAAAIVPEGGELPTMKVTLGLRSDTQSPEKTLAMIEVDAPADQPQVYEFRGRIETFPLPGHNPKFPGLQINVWHGADAEAAKKKSKKPKDSDPSQSLLLVERVEFEGPTFSSWPPPHHSRILFPSELSTSEPRQYARQVLERFLQRAYRRPPTKLEVELLLAMYDKVRPSVDSLELAMREVLPMALISPEFLYLLEPNRNPQKVPLNDYELASRLSYFLWSTMPDETLFQLAERGQLSRPETLAKQVRRMLADDRRWSFVEHFTDQWLGLSALERIAINPEFHPDFDNRLKDAMRKETQHFFAEILHKDLSALNLLESDFTMLNRPLAEHYGLSGPRSQRFEKVALKPEDRRGGLLTQGGFLLSNSTGEQSHPIKRGVWLLERLLDDPPPPPPPDVPELNPEEPDFAGLSLKRQLEVHRKKEACNSCHRGIDPWGIPLEHYDAVGRWRTEPVLGKKRRGKKPQSAVIEANAVLPGGHEVAGAKALKTYLLEHERPRFSQAVTRKLLAYAVGRSLEFADKQTVEELAERFAKADYRLADLITAIVQSEPFRMK